MSARIAAAVHRSAAMHGDPAPDLPAALRLLVTLGAQAGGEHWRAAMRVADHAAWLEQATTTREWAIEWTSVPVDDPQRFEPHHDPAIARRLAETYACRGTRVVQRAALHGPYGETP